MRSFRAIPLLWAWALAAPALAQGTENAPGAKDTSVIESCLQGKDSAAQRRICIGRVADPCETMPDGSSTYGMMDCFDREQAIWDGLLNRVYREALAAFDEEGKAYLKGHSRRG